METLFSISSNSLFSSLQTHKNTIFLPFFTSNSLPLSSQLKSQKWVSLKPHSFHDTASFLVSKKSVVKCLSSDERLATSFDEVESVRRKDLAVFVSGGGSNFRAVHQAILKGDVHGQVVVLVTNKKGENIKPVETMSDKKKRLWRCTVCKRERYPCYNIYPSIKGKPEGLSSNDLVAALSMYAIDFILLAGYLKLIPPELIRAYPNSILNIHPSLLPAFGGKGYYGTKVHKAVIASGARYSGPTIHFVDEHYDTGRILAQRIVPVLADDTAEELAARVLRQEHKMYAEVTAAVCEDRVIWREDGVPIIRSKANPEHYS